MAVVSLEDHSKSVSNHYVIENFVTFLWCHFFFSFPSEKLFVMRLSQISFLFSLLLLLFLFFVCLLFQVTVEDISVMAD